MKIPLLLGALALLFACTASTLAQNRSDRFRLGSRTVRIPAPEGFTDVLLRFERVAGRLMATEDPGNEPLATHLPVSVIPQFEANRDHDLEFYTKVSISKRLRGVDITPEAFWQIQSSVDKEIGVLFGADGTLRSRIEGNTGKGLSALWENQTSVRIDQPLNLGVFDKGEKVISSMVFLKYEVNAKKCSMLATMSFLSVNQRLLFVYAFKTNWIKEDIEMLRDFTKKWTSAIIAANM
jgi:hypothetical protein